VGVPVKTGLPCGLQAKRKPNTVPVMLQMDIELRKELRTATLATGLSASEFVRQCVSLKLGEMRKAIAAASTKTQCDAQ